MVKRGDKLFKKLILNYVHKKGWIPDILNSLNWDGKYKGQQFPKIGEKITIKFYVGFRRKQYATAEYLGNKKFLILPNDHCQLEGLEFFYKNQYIKKWAEWKY